MIKLPNLKTRTWVTSGRSHIFGTLWSTFGLDLISRPGETRLSGRMMITTDNISGLGSTCAFQTFTDQNAGIQYYYAVSGKRVWRTTTSNGYVGTFAIDAAGPDGTTSATSCADDMSDMIPYSKTYLIVTSQTDLYYLTASSGTWNHNTYFTSGFSHMLCNYIDRVYITDSGTKVRSQASTGLNVTPTTSGTNFLDLSNGGYPVTSITCLRSASDGIWIPTINQQEDGCYVFKWDGITANDPNYKYFIPDANGIMSCIIKNDTPWVIDNNGRLMSFNGGTFVSAPNGQLPVRNSKMLKNPLSATNNRWIHPNGMSIFDGRINILINNEYNDSGATIEENIASGIWEYDEKIGWYHKMSLTQYVQSGGTVTDYGQNRVANVGALYTDKVANFNSASADGLLLAGAQYYSDASTTKYGIFTNNVLDTIQKYGYFVITKILSNDIDEEWEKLIIRFRQLLNLTDSIAIKYRTTEVPSTEATITWTKTNTFTSTADLSAYSADNGGDEVEIIQGTGSGKCAHITSITLVAGTYTVVLDDNFSGVSGTAKARFQHWKKCGIITQQTLQYAELPINSHDIWIQIKVCMQFTGANHVFDLTLINAPKKQQ